MMLPNEIPVADGAPVATWVFVTVVLGIEPNVIVFVAVAPVNGVPLLAVALSPTTWPSGTFEPSVTDRPDTMNDVRLVSFGAS